MKHERELKDKLSKMRIKTSKEANVVQQTYLLLHQFVQRLYGQNLAGNSAHSQHNAVTSLFIGWRLKVIEVYPKRFMLLKISMLKTFLSQCSLINHFRFFL